MERIIIAEGDSLAVSLCTIRMYIYNRRKVCCVIQLLFLQYIIRTAVCVSRRCGQWIFLLIKILTPSSSSSSQDHVLCVSTPLFIYQKHKVLSLLYSSLCYQDLVAEIRLRFNSSRREKLVKDLFLIDLTGRVCLLCVGCKWRLDKMLEI